MDKRRRMRVKGQFNVEVIHNGKIIKTRTLDLSLKGCLCQLSPFMVEGEECELVIFFGEEAACKARAKVARVGKQSTALDFLEIDEQGFPHLHRAIQLLSGDGDAVDHELTHPAFEHDPD